MGGEGEWRAEVPERGCASAAGAVSLDRPPGSHTVLFRFCSKGHNVAGCARRAALPVVCPDYFFSF